MENLIFRGKLLPKNRGEVTFLKRVTGEKLEAGWLYLNFIEWATGEDFETQLFAQYPIDKKTIGVYFGFQDIDNKKVFTGDYIYSTVDNSLLGIVALHEGCFVLKGYWLEEKDGYPELKNYWMTFVKPRVVGNETDNPELAIELEKKKQDFLKAKGGENVNTNRG